MSYIYYNPNPAGINCGDCTVRAISKATDKSWEDTYTMLTLYGFMYHDMPSSNFTWGQYLKRLGFKRYLVDNDEPTRYTVQDFCRDNPKGTYILAISGHVVCVRDGDYYDSWDSGWEVPVYYWTKGE